MSKKNNGRLEPYKEYATAKVIDDKWFDNSLVDECDFCGLDDAPIVATSNWTPGPIKMKCKWCAERDNLAYHLQHNGVRRLPSKRFYMQEFIDSLVVVLDAFISHRRLVFSAAIVIWIICFGVFLVTTQ